MAPMESIAFAKGHGTGNDFVVVPDPDHQLSLTPTLVAALCDRRSGIGGDGVLRVVRTAADPELARYAVGPEWADAEWFMDYRNADGSVAEMCGNGVRVFARYLVDSGLVAAEPGATPELVLGTRAGPVVAVVGDEAVSVTMRMPRMQGVSDAWLGERRFTGQVVDCGNPHLVCPLPPGVALADLDLSEPPRVDPAVFPAGANVEFTVPAAQEPLVDAHIRMRVHERGVGETRSCGSGACAAALVALRDRDRARGVVAVDVPGGRLTVALTDTDCALTGPAVLVASGTVQLAALA